MFCLSDGVSENCFAFKCLDGEDALIIDHVRLGVILLVQSSRTRINIRHTVLFLDSQHMRVTVDEQIAVLVRRKRIQIEEMTVGDKGSGAIWFDSAG